MSTAEMSKGCEFHDALAASWNDGYQRGGLKKRLAFVRLLLTSVCVSKQKWLDAGCGAGILTLELSRLGACGLAVDGSPGMIKAAVDQVGSRANGFVFRRVASLASIDADPESFDGVLCSSVLEYVDQVGPTLAELNRVIRIGGKLIVSVPNSESPVRRLERMVSRAGHPFGLKLFKYLGISIQEFTRAELVDVLATFGFEVQDIYPFDPVWPGPLAQMFPPALYFAVATKVAGLGRNVVS